MVMGLSLISIYSHVQSLFQLGLSCGSSPRLQDLPIIINYKQNNSTFIGEACHMWDTYLLFLHKNNSTKLLLTKDLDGSSRGPHLADISQITTPLSDRWVGQHMFCNVDFGQGLCSAGPTSARAV